MSATRRKDAPVQQTDDYRQGGNKAEITTYVHERVRTIPQLIRLCEIDTTEWEVERFVCNVWEQSAKLRNGGTERVVTTPQWQVKAWLRRKVEIIAARAEIAALKADAKRAWAVRRPPKPLAVEPSPYLLQLDIPDLHVGKLAWGEETGYANYDVSLALRAFERAVDALLTRTAGYRFGRVVLVLGHDLFNADNRQGTTTRGTPQAVDGRHQKTFVLVRRAVTTAIERIAASVAPIDVIVLPGNHDTLTTWHLGDSLECWFHETPGVTIHNRPVPRKYVEWGQVMLMFTHGDKGKRPDYPLVMATEQPEMFGRTTYREVHTGHLHQLRVQEHHGIRVRVSPALCPPDAWHSESQYVGNLRQAQAFVWHRDEGLVATAYFTISPQEQAA
jgi:hypothetical protein